MKSIPIAGPWITQKEIDYVADATRTGWYESANLYTERFERAFADRLGAAHATTLSSCTAGLHLSLIALGIGPGDEVIVPDITWIASCAPISYVGATPVFAEIDEQTWCISTDSVQACITSNTRAIIAVDLYGNMPDMEGLREIAEHHKIGLIEDAAEAIGSTYRGRCAGTLGDIGVFSFHGTKTLSTGEGGMLITDRAPIFRRVQSLKDHGRQPDLKTFWPAEIGMKYKMSGIQSALGLAQLERLEELVARKREIFAWYEQELRSVSGLQLNAPGPDVSSSYWMVTLMLDAERGLDKECLMRRFKDFGIDTRPFFYPLSQLPPYANTPSGKLAQVRNKVAYDKSPYGLNLPSSFRLTRDEVSYVCDTLKSMLN